MRIICKIDFSIVESQKILVLIPLVCIPRKINKNRPNLNVLYFIAV